MAPASPKQPRTFAGKKLIADECPNVPAFLPLNFDPKACAASYNK